MTAEEMDNMFDVLYNNITSNQAPGLNAYEKSVFLTKAQDEIVKNYFNPKSKGNSLQEGFDGNAKRQVDFSMLTTVYKAFKVESVKDDTISPGGSGSITTDTDTSKSEISNSVLSQIGSLAPFSAALFDTRSNTKSVYLPEKMMIAINEMVEVTRGTTKNVLLQVVPIKFDDYSRLMSKPYKRPLKNQAWRLINSNTANRADIIIGPSDELTKYILRYIRRPKPIIVSDLDGLTIDGDEGTPQDCELDQILHEEIVQRAVELAKVAWTTTGQDNVQMMLQAGQRSE